MNEPVAITSQKQLPPLFRQYAACTPERAAELYRERTGREPGQVYLYRKCVLIVEAHE